MANIKTARRIFQVYGPSAKGGEESLKQDVARIWDVTGYTLEEFPLAEFRGDTNTVKIMLDAAVLALKYDGWGWRK